VSSIKKLAHPNADFGLRLRLRPTGTSAPEGEPSGSERLRIAELVKTRMNSSKLKVPTYAEASAGKQS